METGETTAAGISKQPQEPSPDGWREPTRSRKLLSLGPLLGLAIPMLLGVLFLVWLGRDRATILGSHFQDYDLQALIANGAVSDGSRLDPASLQGKLVILHFWGTWCPPCRMEYPEVSRCMEDYLNDSDVLFLNVSCSPGAEKDLKELRSATEQFFRDSQIGNRFPIYCDPTAFTRVQLANRLGSGGFAYPSTFVIDPEGIVREAWRGTIIVGELRGVIAKYRKRPQS